MKSLIKTAAAALAIALTCSAAQATVTIALDTGYLYKADGVTPLPVGSTMLLLADFDKDLDFGNLADHAQFASGGEAAILARFPSNDIYDAGLSGFSLGDLDITGIPQGSPLLLAWYDTPYDALATGPGSNVSFGFYRNDNVADFSTDGWFVPSDGSLISLNFLTESAGSDVPNPEAAGSAPYTTTPEAATGLFALMSFGALAFRRR